MLLTPLLGPSTEYNTAGLAYQTTDPAGKDSQRTFDDAGRVTKTIDNYTDGNPTTGTSDEDVTVEMAYNSDGKLTTLTAKNPTTGDQVTHYDNDLGMPTKEYQEHEGAKDGSTLYVQYNYDTTASSGVYTKGLRATSVRYPNERLVHLTYDTSGSTADALNRVDAINDDSSGSPGDSFAEYSYLGGGRIVVDDYTQPDVKLNYDSGTAGAYAGLDRFGRVVDQLWYDYGGSANRDMDVRRTGARASVSPRLCPAATHVCDTWLAVTECTLAPLAIVSVIVGQAHSARSASATRCADGILLAPANRRNAAWGPNSG